MSTPGTWPWRSSALCRRALQNDADAYRPYYADQEINYYGIYISRDGVIGKIQEGFNTWFDAPAKSRQYMLTVPRKPARSQAPSLLMLRP
jgi:hypothetical protein